MTSLSSVIHQILLKKLNETSEVLLTIDIWSNRQIHSYIGVTVHFSGVRKIFSWGRVSFSGIWWSFVFGVSSLWRHNLTSFSCFQTNVLAKFVVIICIFFYTQSPYFMCHCTEYKLSAALQVRISQEKKLNATTLQFITAKISGCKLKQGSKTQSALRQSNLQLQNEAALMSCRIWAVEHRKCAAGLAGAYPGLQDRIMLT